MRWSQFSSSLLGLLVVLLCSAAAAQTPFRIYDNGVPEPAQPRLNLVSAALSCADNPAAKRTDCTWLSSATVNTAAPLGGGGVLSLGGSLSLTCSACLNGAPSATGDIMYSTAGGTAMTALPDVSVGSYMRSGGVAAAPLWSTLKLPDNATTGDVLAATATDTIGRIAAVATNSLFGSQGVGALPAWVTTVTNFALVTPTISSATSPANTAIIDRSAADTNGTTITPYASRASNSTVATSGNQKTIWEELCSQGWKTTATAGSQEMCSGWGNLPVQGTTNPNWAMAIYSRTNGGTRTARASFYWPNTGTITYLTSGVPSAGTSGGAVAFDSTGELKLFGGSGSSGHIRIANGAVFPSASNQWALGTPTFAWTSVAMAGLETVAINPTTCTIGAASGAGATCSVQASSSMYAWDVDITTAGVPLAADGTLVTVVGGSGNAFDAKGHCVLGARDGTTAAAMTGIYVVASGTASPTAIIKNNGIALTTATTYKFTGLCIGGN